MAETQIRSVRDICNLVKAGFSEWESLGNVRVTPYQLPRGKVYHFNYTSKAQFSQTWNTFEQLSRGLIVQRDGTIVARPFDKFFNLGEGGRWPAQHAQIEYVHEKVDGSLGISYWDGKHWRIACRGGLDRVQASWATLYLQTLLGGKRLVEGYTYLFEIVYPENPHVVDYGDVSGLYLLAIRHIDSGVYQYPNYVRGEAHRLGFLLPKQYNVLDVTHLESMRKKLDCTAEGFVVTFSDGTMFKVKGDKYMELHRLVSSLSYRKVAQAIADNGLPELFNAIQPKYKSQVLAWSKDFRDAQATILRTVTEIHHRCPKTTRKEFAEFIQANVDAQWHPYLFKMFDGEDIRPLIHRHLIRHADNTALVG